MSEPKTMVRHNVPENSSRAEEICTQLDILLAQQQRLQNDICQVKFIQSGMNATLDSVQNILMSTGGLSSDFKQNVNDTAATVCSLDEIDFKLDQDVFPAGLQASKKPKIDPKSTDDFTHPPTFATVHIRDGGEIATGMTPSPESRIASNLASSKSQGSSKTANLQKSSSRLLDSIDHTVWGVQGVGHLKESYFGSLPNDNAMQLNYLSENKHLTRMCKSQSICLSHVCESHAFQACVVIVILANTVFLVYEANFMMSNVLQGRDDFPNSLQVGNWIFCILFSIELGLKLAAYRCRFFWNKAWPWNIFDLVIVATAVSDQIQIVFHAELTNIDFTFLRVLRAFKMVRMLRLFRILRFLREMRMLVENIMGSMKAMLWASMLIAMVNFVFGLGFLQASSSFLRLNSEVDPRVRHSLSVLYGSTGRAMLTMYMSTTGGMDWEQAAKPLQKVGRFYYLMFLVYISFSMFVVSNVVTSMFVDKALQASSKDAQYLVKEHLRKKQHYLKMVQRVFDKMEKNPDGSVSVEVFVRHLHDVELVAFCEEIDVEPADLEQFFMALSGDGKRSVDLDTFVVGCIKLKGHAKSADVMEVLIEINKACHLILSLQKISRDPLPEESTASITTIGI